MNNTGQQLRLSKFIHRPCNLILPVDHGLTLGPITGLHPMQHIGQWLEHTEIHGLIAHRGVVDALARVQAIPPHMGLIIHLNGMPSFSNTPNNKVLLTSVKTAIQYGADAVSLQLNINATNIADQLTLLASVAEQAHEFSLPLLVMLYLKDEQKNKQYLTTIRHLLRLCCELSIEMVKMPFPDNYETIPEILEGISSDIHVFFAGGLLSHTLEEHMDVAIQAGACGFCMGRNIFQNKQYLQILKKVSTINMRISYDEECLALSE